MAVNWTKEQQQVINLRNRNLLVSAAAGSGKTAVLVERIISMITDPKKPVDIDQLLVVTFTRAAAAEMKDRISAAISARLEEEPENEHLQKQSVLLHNAHISTIHGFCTYVIQNYFHKTDLDPAYRIADEGELKLLRAEVLQNMLEEEYAEGKPEFYSFVEAFAPGKDDKSLEEALQRVYAFANATPDPEEWLDQCIENYRAENPRELMEKAWMQELMAEVGRLLADNLRMAEKNLEEAQAPGGPAPYIKAVMDDLDFLQDLSACGNYGDYEAAFRQFKEKGWTRLGSITKKNKDEINPFIQERVKNRRDKLKKSVDELREKFFSLSTEEVLDQLSRALPHMEELVRLTRRYGQEFHAIKRERNVMDFSDLEHYALQILLEKTDQGWVRTEAAKELSSHFVEVMTDEYQDSNYLQEYLLEAVSGTEEGRYDRFMVGDMKQSIYAFRMARPDLFMEKYNSYQGQYAGEDCICRKIDLHQNFRSRAEVLEATNAVFRKLMRPMLGGILYDDAAALYTGNKSYPPAEGQEYRAELLLLDGSAPELAEDQNRQAKQEAEVLMVAQRIRELMEQGRVMDQASGQLRRVEYRDMVILLRSEKDRANHYVHVLQSQGIPAYAPSKEGYFSAQEVVTVLNYLRILDNPMQEIPFAAVLRSPVAGCTDRELALIRQAYPQGKIYDSASSYALEGEDAGLRHKLKVFLDTYRICREISRHVSMDELIREILDRTGFGSFAAAMPAGIQRAANLQMLIEKAVQFEKSSYQGLFQFVRYIDNLQKYKVDFGEVNIFGEGENTVRIMTIHKSKGLEFPIVFLCGLGDQFNTSEMREKIVQHSSLGIGLKDVDPELHTIQEGLPENIIKRTLKRDSLGEELRVLYVAMTRAKEKLIMTGRIKITEELYELYQRYGGCQEGPETDHADPDPTSQKQGPVDAGTKSEVLNLPASQDLAPGVSGRETVEAKRAEAKTAEAKTAEAKTAEVKTTEAESAEAGTGNAVEYSRLVGASSYLDWLLAAMEGSSPADMPITARIVTPVQMALQGVETDLVLHQRLQEIRDLWNAGRNSDSQTDSGPQEQPKADLRDGARTEELKIDTIEMNSNEQSQKDSEESKDMQESLQKLLHDQDSFLYPYDYLRQLPAKLSVSDVKKAHMEEEAEERGQELYPEEAIIPIVPDFMAENKEEEVVGARRGTNYHRIFECLDYGKISDQMLEEPALLLEGLGQMVEEMISQGKISRSDARTVKLQDIVVFLQSELGRRMRAAALEGKLYREQPFVMEVAADRVGYGQIAGPEDGILVQGIIDAYFHQGDHLVIVDYKTDRVYRKGGLDLVDKYKVQLLLYKEALERATGLPVGEMFIYSVTIGRQIPLTE